MSHPTKLSGSKSTDFAGWGFLLATGVWIFGFPRLAEAWQLGQASILALNFAFLAVLAFFWISRRRSAAAASDPLLQELLDREHRFDQANASSLLMRTHVGLDGHWLKLPPSLAEFLGYEQAALTALKVEDVTHSEDSQQETIQCRRLAAGEIKSFEMEKRFRCRDGNLAWAHVTYAVVPDGQGRPHHFLKYIRDINERKKSEDTLRASQDYARNIINSSLDVIIAVDSNRKICEFNKAAQETFGFTPEEAIGQHINLLYADELQGRKIHESIRSKGYFVSEVWNRRKNGEMFISNLSATIMKNARGEVTGVVGTSRDITEQKRREQEKRLLQNILLPVSQAPDLSSALGVVLQQVGQEIGWDLGQAWVQARGTDELECTSSWYHAVDTLQAFRKASERNRFKAGVSLPGSTWASRQPVWVSDVEIDPNFPRRKAAMEAGLKSGFAVPVLAGPDLVAVMEFYSLKTHARDERLIELLQAVASQLGTVIDRKRAEDERNRALRFFETLINHTPAVAIQIYDRNGTVQLWNPASEAIYGFTAEEIIGKKAQALLFPPEEVPLFKRQLEAIWLTRQSLPPYEWSIRRKDGSTRVVYTAMFPLIHDQESMAICCMDVDVTDRKVAIEALRQSEERYRAFVQHSSEGVWRFEFEKPLDITLSLPDQLSVLLENTQLAESNDIMAQMHGADSAEQIIGRPLKYFFSAQLERHPEFFHQFIQNDYRLNEASFEAVDGKGRQRRFLSNFIGIVEEGRMVRIWGTQRDISEQNRLQEELRQAQKMEAIGKLAGGIAHDFNNLLMAILGYSNLLLSRLPDNHPIREELGEIKKAGERAAGLTRQLLAYSRKQVLLPKVFDLNEVVNDMLKMLRRLIGEDIDLVTSLDPALGRVKADPGQIEQVIVNLAINARDAMPQGGRLLLETSNVDLSSSGEGNQEALSGPCLRLRVTDNGLGMSSEVRSHLFEPFFTTKEVGKGTGLGLSTVYGIIKQSGGEIEVMTEPGRGTTFDIFLPIVAEAVKPAIEIPQPAIMKVEGKETILLAEDEEGVRELISHILTQQGFKVLEAANGHEALTICRSHQGDLHLLITDLIMPRMSGRELADQVTELRPDVGVLFISGYTDDALVRQGETFGRTGFLQKPFVPSELLQKVRSLLDAIAVKAS